MTAQSYQYKPLGIQGNPIRLLTLWPGKWDDEILCTIHHADLDNELAYRALSYTWGDAHDTREILLQNRPFSVTRNLEIALRHLRQMYCAVTPSIFWVDALAINQRDLQERSSQVRKMHDIFTRARQVVAWTGEADIETEAAFDLFDEISRISESSIATFESTASFGDLVLDGRSFDADSKNWTLLVHFLSRPYFARLWVLPELSAQYWQHRYKITPTTRGHPCVLVCGLRKVPSEVFDFACVMLILWDAYKPDLMIEWASVPGLLMWNCIKTMESASHDLSDFVLGCLRLKTSDPRDRVYALLALDPEEGKDYLVDYAKSTDQVYEDFIIFWLSRQRNLNVLEGEPSADVGLDDHPSWLHQFHCHRFRGATPHDEDNPSAGIPMHMLFDGRSKLLSLGGILIGRVRKVVGPFHLGALRETRQQVTILAADLTELQRDSLCRAMISDWEYAGGRLSASPITQATYQEIRAWLGLNIPQGSCEQEIRTELSENTARVIRLSTDVRSIFVLDSGHVCLGTSNAREGDSVAVLYGGRQCFVLRPRGLEYRHLGTARVQGIMRGEFIKERDRDEDGKPKGSRMFTIC
ncbi:hypothetical protein H2200_005530 [Cladophialophora chaetospira]|uniref:Heterokaryon incompatibility domain-containing protein n=1 Tax=Cladophialophora chaetospira TaxID=386627 RepID=A0AA39CJZ8_9EURO|nr:hypothetical protein H2200_005530 [Cladophialophora chaetospira]